MLTSWEEVITEFYRAPARWWTKCMSLEGEWRGVSERIVSWVGRAWVRGSGVFCGSCANVDKSQLNGCD